MPDIQTNFMAIDRQNIKFCLLKFYSIVILIPPGEYVRQDWQRSGQQTVSLTTVSSGRSADSRGSVHMIEATASSIDGSKELQGSTGCLHNLSFHQCCQQANEKRQ